MNRLKRFLAASKLNLLVFTLAVSAVLFASVGAAYAAIGLYATRPQMYDIGVSLLENGARVSWRDYVYEEGKETGTWDENIGRLMVNMIPEGEKFILGKPYDEALSVRNSGTINTYVRVSLFKYWVDKDGNKLQSMDPALIDLHLVNLGSAWLEDESARTDERTVLYYHYLLNSGDDTEPFTDILTISSDLATKKETKTLPDGTTKTYFTYGDAIFIVEAEVDVVQEHNAQDAVLSAWGKHVVIENGMLSLQ